MSTFDPLRTLNRAPLDRQFLVWIGHSSLGVGRKVIGTPTLESRELDAVEPPSSDRL
jgi:hypothetical protein